MAIWKFNLENPSPRSWVKLAIDSHQFTCMPICHTHSRDTALYKIWLFIENQRSRSSRNIAYWVQHPLRSMVIDLLILDISLFLNLTIRIPGQGHGWGSNLMSQSGSDFLSTHIHFAPCQSVLPFLRYGFFQIWSWKFKVKVIAQSQKCSNITSTHIASIPCQSTLPFLEYNVFNN